MKFTVALLTGIISALSFHAAEARPMDVWAPAITFPTEGAELVSGSTYDFTWNTTAPPQQITNPTAVIYLRQNDRTLPIILAGNTPITQGYVSVTIPWVTTGDYQAVLFGDSGNFSPKFHITSPDPFAQ